MGISTSVVPAWAYGESVNFENVENVGKTAPSEFTNGRNIKFGSENSDWKNNSVRIDGDSACKKKKEIQEVYFKSLKEEIEKNLSCYRITAVPEKHKFAQDVVFYSNLEIFYKIKTSGNTNEKNLFFWMENPEKLFSISERTYKRKNVRNNAKDQLDYRSKKCDNFCPTEITMVHFKNPLPFPICVKVADLFCNLETLNREKIDRRKKMQATNAVDKLFESKKSDSKNCEKNVSGDVTFCKVEDYKTNMLEKLSNELYDNFSKSCENIFFHLPQTLDPNKPSFDSEQIPTKTYENNSTTVYNDDDDDNLHFASARIFENDISNYKSRVFQEEIPEFLNNDVPVVSDSFSKENDVNPIQSAKQIKDFAKRILEQHDFFFSSDSMVSIHGEFERMELFPRMENTRMSKIIGFLNGSEISVPVGLELLQIKAPGVGEDDSSKNRKIRSDSIVALSRMECDVVRKKIRDVHEEKKFFSLERKTVSVSAIPEDIASYVKTNAGKYFDGKCNAIQIVIKCKGTELL